MLSWTGIGLVLAAVFGLLAITGAPRTNAALTGGPDIIAAPASVVNSSVAGGASNNHQQGFNERQVVLLAAALAVDAGAIPAATLVSSHMIFFNQPDAITTGACDVGQVWTFSGTILGVMSNGNGSLEVNSSGLLGAAGTTYPLAPFGARGLEGNNGNGTALSDGYAVSGNSITVGMCVSQPGDWIRVVTGAVAEDCKKGGWQSSPLGFKNQGDCVSYIETNGKNEPGQNVPTSQE